MSEWRECELRDLLNKVIDNRGKNPPYTERGYEVIETSCISGGNKFPAYSLVKKYVDEETYKNWFRGHPQKNDILIITVGNGIGSVSIMGANRGVITQNLIGLHFSEMAEPNFYYYFLNQDSIQDFLKSMNIGSAQPSLKVPHLLGVEVPVPPLQEQKVIAAVLSSLDDKIDLLHRQNKTLEAMAETLFKQWFVVEVREDSETGKISDLVEFNPVRQLSRGTIAPYLEMAALSTQVFHPSNWYDREFSSGTKFINGDTLLARITPCLENGKSAYVSFLKDNQVGWGSTEYIVMRSKLGLHPFFTYALAKNLEFRDYAEGCLSGSSGRQRVEMNHLKNYEIIIPSKNVIDKFNEIISPIAPKLHNNFIQIRTLETLRDNLLPKLMSGEVLVKW